MRTFSIAALTVTLAISTVAAQEGGGPAKALKTAAVGGAGERPNANARGIALDATSYDGFSTSRPAVMRDPRGSLYDPAGGRGGRAPVIDSFTLVMVGK